jgi:hypothetical protein
MAFFNPFSLVTGRKTRGWGREGAVGAGFPRVTELLWFRAVMVAAAVWHGGRVGRKT